MHYDGNFRIAYKNICTENCDTRKKCEFFMAYYFRHKTHMVLLGGDLSNKF